MQIDISLLISILAVALSAFFGIKNAKHTDVKEVELRAAENARLNVKLDGVLSNTAEIKDEIKRQRADITNLELRITRAEESTKSAHKRIDNLCGQAER